MKRSIAAIFLITCFAAVFPAKGDTIVYYNNDFNKNVSDVKPDKWHPVSSAGSMTIKVCTGEKHSGSNSILIKHEKWGKTILELDEINLKVGHLYRLSFYVKTRDAVSYPTDRYPTSVPAAVTMASFPFTNHSPAAGSTHDWQKKEMLFIATRAKDRVRLNFGLNGTAKGSVWFDDIKVEEVDDITEYIPKETIRWCDNGFRYDDRGWIFVHVEGKPYKRGYQYGYLVAHEIAEYINKLGIQRYEEHPSRGWNYLRFDADALMLRKFDKEYLEEMKGIADGAVRAGAEIFGRDINLVDIVTLNSVIDLGQAGGALRKTGNAISGKSFLAAEDELNIPMRQHKCSGFLATNSATKSSEIVFGQIFMWGGYTGPHWNIILDMIPSSGHRLVYETFPGGIHSAADFYINSAGIMIGETTVSQTPFNTNGTPQSNRIRKAAQYASSIDDVVKILSKNNNGMYTNDWLIGDAKTNETAIFLLGTCKSKLWRSSKKDFPGGLTDYYWSNNNTKDMDVRKEYIKNSSNAPYDLAFSPWNRDIAFVNFYKKHNGTIDEIDGVNLWASSPINRPHACDGKITTSEMARNLMFLAHSGKVTLREKFINENHRIPDLPGAVPRLSLGYSIVSPVFIAEKIKALKRDNSDNQNDGTVFDLSKIKEYLTFDKHDMWHNTVYPASDRENWFVSGTASMWRTLNYLPESKERAFKRLRDSFTDLNYRLLYVISREGTIKPIEAKRVYDRYNNYQIPRIRGTYLLHQMRLFMGNKTFGSMMKEIHTNYYEKNMKNSDFIRIAEKHGGDKAVKLFEEWIKREDLPNPEVSAKVNKQGDEWKVILNVRQNNNPYIFAAMVTVTANNKKTVFPVKVTKPDQEIILNLKNKPVSVEFNSMNDIPVARESFYTMSNYYDDWTKTVLVYGTSREIEANHTLALRFSKVLADRYSEILPPVVKDCEISPEKLASSDLILLGGPEDNSVVKDAAEKLGIKIGKNWFEYNGKEYSDSDNGLFAALPNPFNPERIVYLFVSNSALELYQMTKQYNRMPAWSVFRGDRIVKRGYHSVKRFCIDL
ncbi:hypothetical protein J7K93_08780 [bacterium]|nr:hypothetical protein [bacterium]